MTTEADYDRRRVREDIAPDRELLYRAAAYRAGDASDSMDSDINDSEPSLVPDLADPELFSYDDLRMPVVARRPDEFTCSRCFLVHHRNRHARTLRSKPICRDCS